MSGTVAIAPLSAEDHAAWLKLWEQSTGAGCPPNVTAGVWERLIGPTPDLGGLGIRRDGVLAGILHYVLHPATASLAPACLMQDVYVAPEFRRQGLARALVEHLIGLGRAQGWCRILWMVEESNAPAHALYRTLGVRMAFSLYGTIP